AARDNAHLPARPSSEDTCTLDSISDWPCLPTQYKKWPQKSTKNKKAKSNGSRFVILVPLCGYFPAPVMFLIISVHFLQATGDLHKLRFGQLQECADEIPVFCPTCHRNVKYSGFRAGRSFG